MAEATSMRNNALPYPIYGGPWTVAFSIIDADGDPVTGAADLDSEISLNGDTFADCVNEAVEIAAGSGMYYLPLIAAEMTADVVCVQVKTSTVGAKTRTITLYPRKCVPILSGTVAGGAAGYITLPAAAGTLDDAWNGCVCVAVIDANTEARMIDDYAGSTKQASVTPDWNVVPDSDDTFIIYLPDGRQVPTVSVTTNGITTASITQGSITTSAFTAGAIDAAAIATGAVDADALAADAATEIAVAVMASVIEGTTSLTEVLKVLFAVCAGKTDGGGTTTVHFRNRADDKNRVTATLDINGNRTAVTLDLT